MPTLLAALLALAPPPEAWHRYDVHVNDALTRMDVRACFADGLPERLTANDWLATDATLAFRYVRDGEQVSAKPKSNAVILPVPSDDGCIAWTTDLERIAATSRVNTGYLSRSERGDALVLSIGSWFWHPLVLTRTRAIEFRFHLPANMNVSVPWLPLDGEDDVRRFRYGDSPLHWSSLMAIGDLEMRAFDAGGARFDLAIAPGEPSAQPERVLAWLQPAARAVSQLWGAFPVDHVQLLVVPVDDGYDAAPWAQTNRGGGAAAHFYMNASAKPEIFRDDWIATHELAHFALPFVKREDAWLAEGFASYYQNVLRARAGMIRAEDAWQAMLEGFARGNRDTENDTLRDDTLQMHSRGRVMRVYWSGAAIALLADVELRARTQNAWSLDRVLAEFNACCRARERAWSARELFAKFDAISGTDIFDTLYVENVYSRHFPRLAETLADLGVEADDKGIRMRDGARLAGVRRAIMMPRNETPAADAAGHLTGR